MHGLGLDGLLRHYRALRDDGGLAVLCVQENRDGDAGSAARIAGELGTHYGELSDPSLCGKGLVYDSEHLECEDHALRPLPRLPKLSWFERRYIAGGVPDQRYVQIARFRSQNGERFTVINFHLDTAGGNGHRAEQMRAIAEMLGEQPGHIVLCGDTNAFTWRRRRQREVLRSFVEPFAGAGVELATEHRPTHFFARQGERQFTHRMVRAVGRLGVDWPLCYDVVCTNMAVVEHGVLSTPESDHDLVWARFEL